MLRFLTALSTLIFLFSCSTTQQLGTSIPFKTGDNLTYKSMQKTTTEIDMMGIPQKVSGTQGSTYSYAVTGMDADKNVMLDVTTTAMQMEQVTPMMTIRYDSENPEKNEPKEMLGGLDELIGTTFKVQLDPKGKIISTQGADELVDKMVKENPQMASAKELIKSQLNATGGMNFLTGFYPDRPVKIGDTWTKTDTVQAQFAMLAKKTYTLQERSGGQSVITFKSELSPLDDSGMEMQGMKISYDLKGDSKGTISVNDKTGMLVKMEEKTKLGGEMKMSGGPIGEMATNMKIAIENTFEQVDQ
ncbi:MAG: DUF6263 family protein [Saprospiraceae bacterium]